MRHNTEHSELKYGSVTERDSRWKLEQETIVKAFAECLGTFFLLFVGCMTSVGGLNIYPPPERETAFTFGLVVNTIIMMLGHISGAYINPAMTLGAMLLGYRSLPTGIILIISEIVGGVLGFGVLVAVTPSDLWNSGFSGDTTGVCLTLVHEGLSTLQGFIVEFIYTAALMMVNCSAWDARNSQNSDSTSLRIGFAVSALSVAGVKFTGSSMNPIRSFAPALWNNYWTGHWVYWVGPFGGAITGVLIYGIIFKDRRKIEDTSI